MVFPLVPKLQLGNALPGKLQLPLLMGIEAGAWEQEAKDLHPIYNIFMLRCDPHGVMGVIEMLLKLALMGLSPGFFPAWNLPRLS